MFVCLCICKGCDKIFRSIKGIKYHLNNYHVRMDQKKQNREESVCRSDPEVGMATMTNEEEEFEDKKGEDESVDDFTPVKAPIRHRGQATCPNKVAISL